MTSIRTAPEIRLSPSEFQQTVLALKPTTAVFDCDGTLWGGDAGYGFMVWSMGTGLVSRNAIDWIDSRYRLYLTGEVSERTMCAEMVQMYDGLREDELRAAAAGYFRDHIQPHIFPELRTLVGLLREAGSEVWAVSSTNNWVIEESMREFGIPAHRVLAASVKVKNGLITSELIGVPTDETKASGLIAAGVPSPDAVFGNSIHDAAMLEIAKNAFPVNPTAALVEIATQRGWPVYYPESVLADKHR